MGMYCELEALTAREAQLYADAPESHQETLESRREAGRVVSLEKAWHGLHYVLTGSEWDGDPPLNFLVSGGTPIGKDLGTGPDRLLNAEEVSRLAFALAQISDGEFARRFDRQALANHDIYPSIWDEPEDDLLEEYGHYFREARTFVSSAAERGDVILIHIG